MSEKKPTAILASLATLLPELQAVYKDIHAHPELSMHETLNRSDCGGSSQGHRL